MPRSKKVISEAIESISYVKRGQKLSVKFKSNSGTTTYMYKKVPYSVYSAFLASKSKGKFYHDNIKGKFVSFKTELLNIPNQDKAEVKQLEFPKTKIEETYYDFTITLNGNQLRVLNNLENSCIALLKEKKAVIAMKDDLILDVNEKENKLKELRLKEAEFENEILNEKMNAITLLEALGWKKESPFSEF